MRLGTVIPDVVQDAENSLEVNISGTGVGEALSETASLLMAILDCSTSMVAEQGETRSSLSVLHTGLPLLKDMAIVRPR